MEQANYVRVMTVEESEKMNEDLILWVRNALKGPHGAYLYNIIYQLKQIINSFDLIRKGL